MIKYFERLLVLQSAEAAACTMKLQLHRPKILKPYHPLIHFKKLYNNTPENTRCQKKS
jgi:hypothetical protein